MSGARFADACSRIPFSNGTEGEAWIGKWCDYCVRDHGMHGAGNDPPGCSLITENMMDHSVWPEAWLPEPDDGKFALPSRLVCLAFEACHRDGCDGDPGAEGRAERVATVTAYWKAVAP